VASKEGILTPEKIIVIGGHYDSIAWDCDPDTLAPGADDNASGTAAVLEAARVLAEFDSELTLVFIAFGDEEVWGGGSLSFAETAFNEGMNIKVMLNMDMVANFEGDWGVIFNVDSSSIAYAECMAEIAESYTDLIPSITTPILPLSDHYSFYLYGYNSVYTQESSFSPHWHLSTDLVENISIPYLIQVTEMITASIEYLSTTPDTPHGFRALNVGDGNSVFLSWEPNTENDLEGYNIYFGYQSGMYDSVKTVDTEGDTLKNLSEGTTYYIAISAFDNDGYESYLTHEIEIETSSRPCTPILLESTAFDSMVLLEWERNVGELDLLGYNIYRYNFNEPTDPIQIGFVPDPTASFSDDTAQPHILYSYYVTAVDTQIPPNESDPTEEVLSRLATHDLGILVVDNTMNGAGGPFSPTDEEVDEFYTEILADYNPQAFWDRDDSLTAGRILMDYDIGAYSTVLWHTDNQYSAPIKPDTITIRKFLQTGGNLWISGWRILSSLTGESGSSYTFEENSFVSTYFGLDSAKATSPWDTDFIGVEGITEDFPSLSVNSAKVVPLGGLFSTELLLPPFEGTIPIYSYVSSDSANSEYHGMAVALLSSSVDYDLILTDFPVFFMNTDDAKTLVTAVMNIFGEPVSIENEGESRPPFIHALLQNYPNPFNPTTTIAFDIPQRQGTDKKTEFKTRLTIFDMRGKLVKVLIEEELSPGTYQVVWDGKNENGTTVSSGVYFFRMVSESFKSTRKMLLLR
jgi:hypothetical protein